MAEYFGTCGFLQKKKVLWLISGFHEITIYLSKEENWEAKHI